MNLDGDIRNKFINGCIVGNHYADKYNSKRDNVYSFKQSQMIYNAGLIDIKEMHVAKLIKLVLKAKPMDYKEIMIWLYEIYKENGIELSGNYMKMVQEFINEKNKD